MLVLIGQALVIGGGGTNEMRGKYIYLRHPQPVLIPRLRIAIGLRTSVHIHLRMILPPISLQIHYNSHPKITPRFITAIKGLLASLLNRVLIHLCQR